MKDKMKDKIKITIRREMFILTLSLLAIGIFYLGEAMVKDHPSKKPTVTPTVSHQEKKVIKSHADADHELIALLKAGYKDHKPLPLPKKPIYTETEGSRNSFNQSAATHAENQRCYFENQSYVTGDIVKTAQGWMRCTATITFDANNHSQTGSPAWTQVQ